MRIFMGSSRDKDPVCSLPKIRSLKLKLISGRTMSIISLLDCAFSFYQNHPCRLSHTEMECEFPCDESIFSSPHPFSEPNFRFTREVTISEAFQSLFEEYPKQDTSSSEPNTPVTSYERIRAGLRVFDMFIIIHSKLITPIRSFMC